MCGHDSCLSMSSERGSRNWRNMRGERGVGRGEEGEKEVSGGRKSGRMAKKIEERVGVRDDGNKDERERE